MNKTSNNPQPKLSPEEAKEQYQYNYNYIPPLAMVEHLPPNENFSTDLGVMVARQAFELLVNTLTVNKNRLPTADEIKSFLCQTFRQTLCEEIKKKRFDIYGRLLVLGVQILFCRISTPGEHKEVKPFITSLEGSLGKDFLKSLLGQLLKDIKKELQENAVNIKADSIEDFKELFKTIELPQIAYTFQKDEAFAYMRIAGPNPVMIKRVSKADERLPITNEQYQEVMGTEDSLEAAMESGRLYLADYSIFANAVNGTYTGLLYPHPEIQKYLYSPLALFAVPPGSDPNRMLKPVAIQCNSQPGPKNPIITPKTGEYAWLIAKTVVQIADANYHEAVSHLGRTHLFIEPFAIATPRNLSKTHRLRLLLEPHFQGTLAINNAAQQSLVPPRGGVDGLLSCIIDNSRVLAVLGLQSYGFNSAMLPKQLKEREVDDTEALPVYPYRDDALLIWDAIHEWVSAYLSLYYKSDKDIQQEQRLDVKEDKELQAWAKELTDFNGGRVIEFGNQGSGKIHTLEYLIKAATLIIFTASAQHAAVNFPQLGLMSFAPSMPTAGYIPAKSLGSDTTEEDYLNLLPPLNQAQDQLNLLYLLGSTYYTTLGQYEDNHFSDPQVQEPLQAFQKRLKEIEAIIEQRNFGCPNYQYLRPSKIPQSINI
ncbi:MAG: lipoxygenase [Symploca sp. SIO2C1]|nr:lipoxygenase [Symploca sp. SIO2C1]